jgi:hypothetical protein
MGCQLLAAIVVRKVPGGEITLSRGVSSLHLLNGGHVFVAGSIG